jgi:trans-aconitate 2-methyltransferase
MIEKAKKDYPDLEWITADASTFAFAKEYDIVFSNAAIQWMPDHDSLVPRLFEAVSFRGALAVQVPADSESPLREALLSVSSREKWSQFTSGAEKLMTYHTTEYYYDILSATRAKFDLWETVYHHVMRSHIELVEWYKGTGMRPFLERLPDDESKRAFEKELLAECRKSYQIRSDRRILFPFKRIFFVAYKNWRRCGTGTEQVKPKGTKT